MGEPAHPRSLTRALAVRTHAVWKWTKGQTKNQTSSPTGWLRMHIWRMSLWRAKSTIIWWDGLILCFMWLLSRYGKKYWHFYNFMKSNGFISIIFLDWKTAYLRTETLLNPLLVHVIGFSHAKFQVPTETTSFTSLYGIHPQLSITCRKTHSTSSWCFHSKKSHRNFIIYPFFGTINGPV